MVKISIIIDQEFKRLIPPLTEEEFKQLEENCIKDGIRDSLIVWDNGKDWILIDGHNRYEIAQKHNLPYSHRRMEFENRDDVKAWILRNQLGRRNVDKWVKFDMTKELEALEKEKAKERQGTRSDIVPTLAQSETGKVRDKMAELIGVSHGTYDKMKRIDENATEGVKKLVREGKLSINQGYNSTFPKRPDPIKEAKQEHEDFQKKKEEAVVNFADIQRDKQNQRILNNELTQDILKLISAVDKFGLVHKISEIEKLAEEFTEDYKKDLIDRLSSCNKVIYKIQTALS